MCGFIRRCKFRTLLSLIVPSLALWQISARTDLSPTTTRPHGATGSHEGSYHDLPLLALGQPIDQVLARGEWHSYKITLNSGQYLRLLITPSGTELCTTVYAPDGQKLSQFASRRRGPTRLSVLAEVSGTYRLEVRSLEKDPGQGRYELSVEEIRPANALDIHR